MKKLETKTSRSSSSQDEGECSILLVGTGQFGAGLQFNQFKRFSLNEQLFSIKSLQKLGSEKDMESMSPPILVILGLVGNVFESLVLVRQVWPYASVIIAADESQVSDVYPLLAAGASDFVSLSASNAELQEKCLIRIGTHQARVQDSSRTFGRLTINLLQRTVTNGKETAHLTPIEVNIVRTLADNLGGVVERNKMKQICWGDVEITDNALNRKIYEVRRTLRRLSETVNIRTIYGLGFELKVRGT